MNRYLLALAASATLTIGCGGTAADPAATESGEPGAVAAPESPGGATAPATASSPGAPAGAAPRDGARFGATTLAPSNATAATAPAPEFREVTIPAGTALSLRLSSAVASDSSQVEDVVRATLTDAVQVDGAAVLPAGTELAGNVTDVERSGRVKGLARLAFRFGTVRYQGEQLQVRTETIERTAEATKGEDATKIGIGTGVGAALGAVLGGGDGAAKGAAIGAAAGTGAVLATRGQEVRLGPGDVVRTRLAAPLMVRVPVGG